MNPLLAGALLFALCSLVCFFLWTAKEAPLSAGALLTQAEQADTAVIRSSHPGVIYQKVKITSGGHSFDRAIYRDPEKKRRPRQQPLSPTDEQAKARLDRAGVSWDEPLSAVNYSAWRDSLPVRQDTVTRSGKNQLTLITSAGATGPVARETLTVRESDFHPIERTVEMRGEDTIEIAELNYDVMPWGAVNQDWFEPASGAASDASGVLSTPLERHAHPAVSSAELGLAELQARYTLHQLAADLGEPIEVNIDRRNPATVTVSGIVSTAERKHELVAALDTIPHVSVRLQTEALAAANLAGRLSAASGRTETPAASRRSPIDDELRARFADPNAFEAFRQSASTITELLTAHAWALRHLSERYESADDLSLQSHKLLQAMQADHLRAMRDEASALDALLRPALNPIASAFDEPFPEQSIFVQTEMVRRLTLGILSGDNPPGEGQNDDPHQFAGKLLHALRGLRAELDQPQSQ
jgi:hypothetical protein